jgi:hypothetical protein
MTTSPNRLLNKFRRSLSQDARLHAAALLMLDYCNADGDCCGLDEVNVTLHDVGLRLKITMQAEEIQH